MSRQEIFDKWKIDSSGGPVLDSFSIANRFALIAFDNVKALNLLKLKLNNLKQNICDMDLDAPGEINRLSELFLKLQYTDHVIRRIVKLRVLKGE